MAQVGEANRKDVRNAVEVATKAQPAWAKKSPFNRQQILYYIAENLDIRRRGFARRLTELTGMSQAEAELEVSLSVARLFYWASWADKYGGAVQETQLYGEYSFSSLPIISVSSPQALSLRFTSQLV